MMTWDQVSGVVDRLLLALGVWLVSKGYVSASDWAQYAPIILALLSAAWGAYVNRPKAIVQSAAALPGTTVVTSPALATSTPETNVVSSATSAVVQK